MLKKQTKQRRREDQSTDGSRKRRRRRLKRDVPVRAMTAARNRFRSLTDDASSIGVFVRISRNISTCTSVFAESCTAKNEDSREGFPFPLERRRQIRIRGPLHSRRCRAPLKHVVSRRLQPWPGFHTATGIKVTLIGVAHRGDVSVAAVHTQRLATICSEVGQHFRQRGVRAIELRDRDSASAAVTEQTACENRAPARQMRRPRSWTQHTEQSRSANGAPNSAWRRCVPR